MADEGFESYHIPQQSRREKLRVVGSAQNHLSCVQPQASDHHLLLPLYDPTSYISTTEFTHDFHHPHQHRSDSLTSPDESCKTSHHPAGCSNIVKEEGVNLMGFMGGSSCLINNSSNTTASSSTSPDQLHHHPYNYLDPRSSAILPLNPTSIHDINNSPFIFSPQSLQNLDHGSYNAVHDQVVAFRPETLSLSLSSSSHPFDLNLQKYGSAIYSTPAHDDIHVLTSATNVGPFTAYVSILKESRFLKPAQQLLEELFDVGIHGIYSEKIVPDASLIDPPLETLSSCTGHHGIVDDGGECGRKKSRLISMLDEVFIKYKQYCHQIQAIVTSFEYVSGLGNAAPYAHLAVKAMSKQFRCLKNVITDQLQFHNKASGQQFQRSLHNAGFLEHQPVWRPQRGLPERAVSVLRAWLFEHFLHPYPTDGDKLMLAKQTGLSRSQVSNWFINARVRLWKPMVEEIHMLETSQAEKSTQSPDELLNTAISNNINGTPPSVVSLASDKYLHSGSKRHLLQDIRNQNHDQNHDMTSNLSYNLSSQSDVGVSTSTVGGAGNGGVSLTLGLHQNNGAVGFSEPFPIHARAQHFGLDTNGDHHQHAGGYIMSGFEMHNRHFGRNISEGQLLHDFVG